MLERIDPEKFETLIEINTLINSNYADATSLLTHILESATRLTEGEASSLVLKNPEDGKLYFEIALGPKGRDVKKFSPQSRRRHRRAGWPSTASRLSSTMSKRIRRFYGDISKSIGFPTYSILAVPMIVRDNCVGVLEIINKKDKKYFTQDDLQWLEIFAVQAAIAIENARYLEKAREEIGYLRDQIDIDKGYHVLIAESPVIKEKLDLIERVAQTDSSVLILGESGVGKELFAEQLHLRSARRNGPFVRVNCAALPEGLLESELFGHVKGAFTDAVQNRRGRFELADGGTIFLDEIGDLPLKLQAKLLRVLQQKTFERVGSSDTVTVDVRIVAATNRDIETLVEKGEFRSDLYYRLNVLPLYVPPLRQRKEDIPALADHFLKKFSRETKKQFRGFTDEADGSSCCPIHGPETSGSWRTPSSAPASSRRISTSASRTCSWADDPREGDPYGGKSLKDSLLIFKRHFIRRALEDHDWNQTETAKVLDIQRTYLSRLIKELSINDYKE